METQITELQINGETYVKKCTALPQAVNSDGLPYTIIRTYSAGVFAGYLKSRTGLEVELVNARRIYYWSGAATLSEMALSGVSNPKECKFPAAVPNIILTQAIEIIPATETARKSLEGVKIWTSK